jgi:hypothetical protein
MFTRMIKVNVITKFEDHFKVARLLESYKESGSNLMYVTNIEDKTIEIIFRTCKGCLKDLERDLAVLNLVGIEGRIKS